MTRPNLSTEAGAGTGPGSVLDAHVHLWDPDLLTYDWLEQSPLRRRIDADELRSAAEPTAEFVLVQGDCAADEALAEVAWLSEQSASLPAVRGIVGYAPLHLGARAARHLEALRRFDSVVGVRRLIQDEPAGYTAEPSFREGVALLSESGLVVDLCVRAGQLAETTALVRATPGVSFVLDHLGKPTIGTDPAGWRADLAALAELPNVACKLSGLTSEVVSGPGGPDAMAPYLRHALQTFGPDRCLFGSDWPVLTLTGDYADWRRLVTDVVTDIAPEQVDRVLSGNARDLYRPLS